MLMILMWFQDGNDDKLINSENWFTFNCCPSCWKGLTIQHLSTYLGNSWYWKMIKIMALNKDVGSTWWSLSVETHCFHPMNPKWKRNEEKKCSTEAFLTTWNFSYGWWWSQLWWMRIGLMIDEMKVNVSNNSLCLTLFGSIFFFAFLPNFSFLSWLRDKINGNPGKWYRFSGLAVSWWSFQPLYTNHNHHQGTCRDSE